MPLTGTPIPPNLARDPEIVARVKRDLVPMLKVIRDDRVTLRSDWLRYHRIWGVKREHQAYQGRYATYLPIGRRMIENWVSRVRRELFPDADWYDVKARRTVFADREASVRTIQDYFLKAQMKVPRHASRYCRQLVMLGTSPVRNVWHLDEEQMRVYRDLFDAEGRPTGKFERADEKVLRYIGPTFRPVDLFAFYVWPTTTVDVKDATISFEDLLVPAAKLEALSQKPLWPGREKDFGYLYENWDEVKKWRAGYRELPEKFAAEQQRLADKGFTHPLDTRLPEAFRPCDVSEIMWETDLEGEGTFRYLVSVVGDEVPIRIQRNPFLHGESLWLAGKFVEVQNEFYGRGLPEVFDLMQYFANDLANQAADALVWATNPIAVVDLVGVQDPGSLRMAPGAKWLASINSVQFTAPPQGPAQAGFAGLGQILSLVTSFANPSPTGGVGPAPSGRGRAAQTATGASLIAADYAVDIREVVENQEAQVFAPLLARDHSMALQFLDRALVFRVAGADGMTLVEKPISAADLVGEFDFEWMGSTQMRDQQVRGAQLIQWLGVVSKLPREAQNLKWDELQREIGRALGVRNPERFLAARDTATATDWRLEHDLFRVGRGAEVHVSPADPDIEHAREHDRFLASDEGRALPDDQRELLARHIEDHVRQAVAETVIQQIQAQRASMARAGIPPPDGMGPGPDAGAPTDGRLPPPVGPGRLPSTTRPEDVFRQMPRDSIPMT